ncbi:MAG: thioredoxin-related protein [Planctomycetota bacterium]
MQKNIVALTLGGLLLLSAPAISSEGWIEDFDQAVKIAKAEKKDLLVDFTGSDWCGWCHKLDAEVFSHEAFTNGVKDNFILVSLDFPKQEENIAKVPNPERNRELQAKYGVQGFPTILLMSSDGEVYGKTGYRKGGPEGYVEHLNELREPVVKIREVRAGFENATDTPGKVSALTGIIDLVLAGPFASSANGMLLGPLRTAFELDPKNESGLKLRALSAISHLGVHDVELMAMAKELDGKNEHGVLETQVHAAFQAVKGKDEALKALGDLDALNLLGFKDSSVGFLLNFTAANWGAGPLQDSELAKSYAKVAKGLGSTDEDRMKVIDGLLEG